MYRNTPFINYYLTSPLQDPNDIGLSMPGESPIQQQSDDRDDAFDTGG